MATEGATPSLTVLVGDSQTLAAALARQACSEVFDNHPRSRVGVAQSAVHLRSEA